jgi:hypothetical protein
MEEPIRTHGAAMRPRTIKGRGLGWLAVPALAGLALLATATTGRAQPEDEVIANVPFQFVVGSTVLPAGRYDVRALTIEPDDLRVVNTNGHETAIAEAVWGDREYTGDRPELLFKVYGTLHFLAGVRIPGQDGWSVPLTRTDVEHELVRVAALR